SEFFGPPGDGRSRGSFVQDTPPAAQPPPVQQTQVAQTPTQATIPAVAPAAASLPALTTTAPTAANFSLPSFVQSPTVSPTAVAAPTVAAVSQTPSAMPAEVGRAIRDFTGGWQTPGPGQGGTGPIRTRRFRFTAYLAQYSGGDWDSTVQISRQGGKLQIVKGSLPNLLFVMRRWSADRIEATPDPVPLNLASEAIFTSKPPFIFFTGRRDFVLTDAEVANLRKYIQVGGAIWGDSSLPGRRSRFDIAFRREMRRVIPDLNKDWEPLPANHPLFSGDPRQVYYPEIRSVPPGINFYQEPIEVLKYYDQIAILYSANSYADQWQIGITEDGKYDTRTDRSGNNFIAINRDMFNNREVYFRNLDEPALVRSYQFGINVITHLLTRWEDPLRRVPRL
ncbi:MAG: DUF4159 domain-containing protein, partial [Verrucomicrobiia bacterium]